MKISIKYLEIQTFERDVDVELTKKQLAEFKKTGKCGKNMRSIFNCTIWKIHLLKYPLIPTFMQILWKIAPKMEINLQNVSNF